MLIFVAIALAAFIIVAGAFFFGHDADHDMDHGADHDSDHGGDHTISLFSTKVIGTLCMGFGAAGAVAQTYGLGYATSSLIGVACGIGLAGVMYCLLNVIVRQQASSLVATASLVGSTGTVAVAIGPGEMGEVGVSFAGQYSVYAARAVGPNEIAKGKTVRVVQTIGSQLMVEEA